MKLAGEMTWRVEPDVEAARKLPGWGAFHRECGKRSFYFDHPAREGGRRGTWVWDCWTSVDRVPIRLSQGRAATVLAALDDAHEKSGRADAQTRAAFASMAPPSPGDDFDSLIDDDDFGSLMG